MKNAEIIETVANAVGIEYTGENLKTFAEWKKAGYSVKKGEKAVLKCDLWKPFTKKLTDKDGKPVIDPKTGKQETEQRFMLKASHLFLDTQVEPIKAKATKKKSAKKVA